MLEKLSLSFNLKQTLHSHSHKVRENILDLFTLHINVFLSS